MQLSTKKLLQESMIWLILIVVTYIITTIYDNNKPENRIYNSYQKTYEYLVEAQNYEKSNMVEVQEVLDMGRAEIKKIKNKVKLNEEMGSKFDGISIQFDILQEKIISEATEKIKKLQKEKLEGKNYSNTMKEIDNLIKSLESGESKRAKSASENLKKIIKGIGL